jgi:endoglucanase
MRRTRAAPRWSSSSVTYASDIKSAGFNSVRIPVAPQTLDDNDPQGKDPNLKNAQSARIQGAYTALKEVVKACSAAGLYVLLDMHTCSNYVGWRKGRLDARPPWADKDRQGYDYKREEYSCAETGNPSTVKHIAAYNATKWKKLAGLGAEIGVDNIMGIDIYNEPWDYSWGEWKGLTEQAYAAINAVNPNILIYVQGISGTYGSQDGTPETKGVSPHGTMGTNPNWGENLFEAGDQPPNVPKSKLVYSPHTYGPAVFQQTMFVDPKQPECAGLEGDALGEKKCQMVINQALLDMGWHEHFGYLKAQGYAIAIGEFGGNMDWPNKTNSHNRSLWSYISDKTIDQKWQEAFVDYLMREGIYDSFYWSINPESADTFGFFTTTFDPVSNDAGWGTWGSADPRKVALLNKLWNATAVADPGKVIRVNNNAIKKGIDLKVSGSGSITYSLAKEQSVSLKVYDLKGNLLSEVVNGKQAAGAYTVDRKQIKAGPGLYLVSFKAGDASHNQVAYLAR